MDGTIRCNLKINVLARGSERALRIEGFKSDAEINLFVQELQLKLGLIFEDEPTI